MLTQPSNSSIPYPTSGFATIRPSPYPTAYMTGSGVAPTGSYYGNGTVPYYPSNTLTPFNTNAAPHRQTAGPAAFAMLVAGLVAVGSLSSLTALSMY